MYVIISQQMDFLSEPQEKEDLKVYDKRKIARDWNEENKNKRQKREKEKNTGDRRGGCKRRIEEKKGVGRKEGRWGEMKRWKGCWDRIKKDFERKHWRLCCQVDSNEFCVYTQMGLRHSCCQGVEKLSHTHSTCACTHTQTFWVISGPADASNKTVT